MVEKSSEKAWEQLAELLDKYRGTKGSVIPVLQQAQEIFGYLPKDVLIKISNEIDVPISQIYGVVTFYAERVSCVHAREQPATFAVRKQFLLPSEKNLG